MEPGGLIAILRFFNNFSFVCAKAATGAVIIAESPNNKNFLLFASSGGKFLILFLFAQKNIAFLGQLFIQLKQLTQRL
jgi:hypothetical protein